jgi:hypothetical protein
MSPIANRSADLETGAMTMRQIFRRHLAAAIILSLPLALISPPAEAQRAAQRVRSQERAICEAITELSPGVECVAHFKQDGTGDVSLIHPAAQSAKGATINQAGEAMFSAAVVLQRSKLGVVILSALKAADLSNISSVKLPAEHLDALASAGDKAKALAVIRRLGQKCDTTGLTNTVCAAITN